MDFQIPKEIIEIYRKLDASGYKIYFVGGCVRNMLLEKEVKDWDFTTNATPEEILKLFPDGFYDNQFGTVGVPINSHEINSTLNNDPTNQTNNSIVEITTFRTEWEYQDARHPKKVAWGKTIEEDLERRDFTINAIALNFLSQKSGTRKPKRSKDFKKLSAERRPQDIWEIHDPFHGQEDLKNKIIRAVGDPNKRFKEDALRLMRAIRFATQFGFTIDPDTWKSIQEDAVLLPMISGERIRVELLKILGSDYPYEGIILLKNANLLQHILPEILEGQLLSQSRPGRHHIYDVYTHNLMSLKTCPSKNPIVRFATLIHDIGKSRVIAKDENGLVIFYNHEVEGAKIAYDICNRLHFSKKERQKIGALIRWHMFSVDEHVSDAGVRRFIRRIGVENVKDMIDLRIGDRLGSGIPTGRAESWRLKKFKERIEEELKPAPFSIRDLTIDGIDIMQELQIKPGPQIGKILQQLFEEVDEDLSLNTRKYLLKRLKHISF